MKVVRDKTGFTGQNGTAVALGFFDGVHNGHRAVIGAALAAAGSMNLTPAVFTFTLPAQRGAKGGRLQSDAQKHALLEEMGVELCFEPEFASFEHIGPQEFFEEVLLGQYGAKALSCGENFCFGKGRSGTVQTLRALCDAAGVQLEVVPTTLWQGKPVSSSRIRAALGQGDIEAVNAMLGYPYELLLPVQHGRGIGHEMGFPTINQQLPGWMQPPAEGVYITSTVVGSRAYPSATGYGSRPTVQGKHTTCETFIPGFKGDLYGEELAVRFYKKIDDTQCFASKEELNAAVQRWAQQALAYFAEKTGL